MVIENQKFEIIEYESDGSTWHDLVISKPTWKQIEAAIRVLDQFLRPIVILSFMGGSNNDKLYDLTICGGKGVFYVYAMLGDVDGMREYFDESLGSDDVEIWTSDQGGSAPEYNICYSLESVLKIARYFFDHGDLDPSYTWVKNG